MRIARPLLRVMELVVACPTVVAIVVLLRHHTLLSRLVPELSHLGLTVTGHLEEFLDPGNRFLFRGRLNDRKPSDDLLRFGERTVGDGHLSLVLPDANPELAGHASLGA